MMFESRFCLMPRGDSRRLGIFRRISARIPSWSALMLVALVFSTADNSAATIAAASTSREHVGSAVALARDGDTVEIPEGTSTWTTALIINKGITVRGAGLDKTIILDNVTGTQNDQQAVFAFATVPGRLYRLSGLEIRNGSTRSPVYSGGAVRVTGSTKTFRIDNCRFSMLKNRAIYIVDAAVGVIDNCVFDLDRQQGLAVFHRTWGGHSWGDGSWAEPVDWGSTNAVYIESNFFTAPGGNHPAVLDSYGGARWVFRHNRLRDCIVGVHGTESTSRYRGTRSFELYKNEFVDSTTGGASEAIHWRSGTGVVWSNTVTGNVRNFAQVINYRATDHFPDWPGADGTSGWDLNDPRIYAEGTHNGTENAKFLRVEGAQWTPNQWAGFTVRNLNAERFSCITSNTTDSIYYTVAAQSAMMSFNVGDQYRIVKVLALIDQCGRSTGDLLSGQAPQPRWLNQVLEPIYEWGNWINGQNGQVVTKFTTIREGTDFLNDTTKPGYAPLIFPHPLVDQSATLPSIDPPTNLRVSK